MLSILICSLESREKQRNELLDALRPQVKDQPVEILVETDKGEMKIGTKRNRLLRKARRRYLAFIDDDDMVSPDYVAKLVGAAKDYFTDYNFYPDCIGMCGMVQGGSKNGWQFRHSITVNRWCKDKQGRIFFRTPNHLNPILTKHARKCTFPEENWGEDRAYSDQVRQYLKTEKFVEGPVYFYKEGNK